MDRLAAEGLDVDCLSANQASPGLRRAIASLARQTGAPTDLSRPFAERIADRRPALEVGVIQALAESLVAVWNAAIRCRNVCTTPPSRPRPSRAVSWRDAGWRACHRRPPGRPHGSRG